MESTYLYALASISTTFVGFSALIMMVRQTLGDGLSELEAWITRTFVQLGFLVTAGAMTPPLLALCGLSDDFIWRLCSGIIGAIMLIFVAAYPTQSRRRQACAYVCLSGPPPATWPDCDTCLECGRPECDGHAAWARRRALRRRVDRRAFHFGHRLPSRARGTASAIARVSAAVARLSPCGQNRKGALLSLGIWARHLGLAFAPRRPGRPSILMFSRAPQQSPLEP
jgi:hypothetical protein